jgi:choline dehydrogenase
VFFFFQSVKELAREEVFEDGFPCLALQLRPQSKGTIRLNTTDPFDHPLIDPNYLDNQHDVDTLVRGGLIAMTNYNNLTP